MRCSTAGLALIKRLDPGGAAQYLTQWSDTWQMFSLIGGHVKAGESFRECCVREVAEELQLTPDVDFRVAPLPLLPAREYTAISGSAGVETKYCVELYVTELLTLVAADKVDANLFDQWLSEGEIRRWFTDGGKPISAQVETVLELFGVIQRANKPTTPP